MGQEYFMRNGEEKGSVKSNLTFVLENSIVARNYNGFAIELPIRDRHVHKYNG